MVKRDAIEMGIWWVIRISTGSPVLHPRALHFFMSLHPEGKNALHPKWHFIQYATTSPSALRPEWHFIPSTLHLEGHFIPSTLHLKGHFISQRTSSHKSFHPIRHFILWLKAYESFNPTSHFIPVNTSCLILFSTSSHYPIFHFIPDITSSQ